VLHRRLRATILMHSLRVPHRPELQQRLQQSVLRGSGRRIAVSLDGLRVSSSNSVRRILKLVETHLSVAERHRLALPNSHNSVSLRQKVTPWRLSKVSLTKSGFGNWHCCKLPPLGEPVHGIGHAPIRCRERHLSRALSTASHVMSTDVRRKAKCTMKS